MYQVCPACRHHPVSIGKPVCLSCWRFVPVYIQTAMYSARRKCEQQPEDFSSWLSLDTVIHEAIKAARENTINLEGPS